MTGNRRDGLNLQSGQRQRGQFLIMTAVLMVIVLLVMAIGLDTGRLMMDKRGVQRTADMAALSAAAGVCNGTGILTAADAQMLAIQGAQANGFSASTGDTLQTTVGTAASDANGLWQFSPLAAGSTALPNAVRVVVGRTVRKSFFAGGYLGGNNDVTLQGNAVAYNPGGYATISAGSFLLNLETDKSPLLGPLLNGMLGTKLDLSAVSFNGLANANVSLLNLLQGANDAGLANIDLGVGGIQQLLNTNVNVAQALDIFANAARRAGFFGLGLDAFQNQLIGATINNVNLTLGQLLKLTAPATSAALNTQLNLLDLINGTILVANGQHAVSIPNLGVNLGGLASIGLTLNVIEPPQIAMGPAGLLDPADDPMNSTSWRTVAKTSQLSLLLSINAKVKGILTLATNLDLQVAQGWAALKSLGCGVPGTATITTRPGLLSLGEPDKSIPGIDLKLTLLGLNALKVQDSLPSVSPTLSDLSWDGQSALPVSWPVSTNAALALGNGLTYVLDHLQVQVLGLNLGGVLQPILSLLGVKLGNLVSVIVAPLLHPIFNLLGLSLGDMQVTLINVSPGGHVQLITSGAPLH